MSEPPKKTRSRKQDVRLVVCCDAPKEEVAEGRSTSVYEIDIQGGYDFHNKLDKRVWLKKDLKEAISKESQKELDGECQEEVEGHPEAHYTKIMETFSVDQRPSRAQNASFIVQKDILTEENKEQDRKSFTGKTNKKRQVISMDTKQKFRKQIKNYIIETFIGDKCRDIKSIVQNYNGVLDGNEVHLHHHEHHHHHHHYYANGQNVVSESPPQTPIQGNVRESPEIFVATMTANEKGQETILNSHETQMEDYDRSSDAPSLSLGTVESHKSPKESDRLPSESRSLGVVDGTNPKNEHNSTISFLSPTFETDLKFIKSEECRTDSVMTESTEIGGIKVEKSKGSHTYISLVENFKSFNSLTSPMVITDHKTVPKILYIRCDCSALKGMGTQEEADSFHNKNSEGKDDPESKLDGGEDESHLETDQSINPLPNQCHRGEEESSEEVAFEVWTSRLKKELQEIKNELKRIEDKQVVEKISTNTSIRKEKTKEKGSDHEIVVYSSKTFIIRPSQDADADA